jgi:hypothetical protein
MALRWASVGTWENAGITTANMTVAVQAQSTAARLTTLSIWKSFSLSRWSRRYSGSEFQDGVDKKYSGAEIIFFFGFHCKWIVAIHRGRKAFLRKPFSGITKLGHGNEAYAFVAMQVDWQYAAAIRRFPCCCPHIAVCHFRRLRTK